MHIVIVDKVGVCWAAGDNKYGQCGIGSEYRSVVSEFVEIENIPPMIQTSVSDSYTLFLDINFNIWMSGQHLFSDNAQFKPTKIEGVQNIIQIASGETHYLLLDDNGYVFSAGYGSFGQLGHGNEDNLETPAKIKSVSTKIKYIFCGDYQSILIDVDGVCYVFGLNHNGQLGLCDEHNRNIPTIIRNLPPIKSGASGYHHTMLIDEHHSVYAFGDNKMKQLGFDDIDYLNVPLEIPNIPAIKDCFCGRFHTILLDTDHNIWVFGSNTSGQLGLNQYNDTYGLTKSAENINTVICYGDSTIISNFEGDYYVFGDGSNGQLGIGNVFSQFTPTKIKHIKAHVNTKRFYVTKSARNSTF